MRKTNAYIPRIDELPEEERLAALMYGPAGLAAQRHGILGLARNLAYLEGEDPLDEAGKELADAAARDLLLLCVRAFETGDAAALRALADFVEFSGLGDFARLWKHYYAKKARRLTIRQIQDELGPHAPDARTLRRLFKGLVKKGRAGAPKGQKHRAHRRVRKMRTTSR